MVAKVSLATIQVVATLADWGLALVRGTGAGLRVVWLLVRLCGMC